MLKNKLFLMVSITVLLLGSVSPAFAIGSGKNYGLQDTATALGYNTDVQETIPVLILQWLRIFLGFISIIFLGYTLYAGVRWISARGKEDLVTKAKDSLQGSITGLIIIVLAYALVNFVLGAIGIQNASNTTPNPTQPPAAAPIAPPVSS